MVVLLPILVAVIGVLVWALSSNDKVKEMGRIAFFCGLLAFLLLDGGGQVISILGR